MFNDRPTKMMLGGEVVFLLGKNMNSEMQHTSKLLALKRLLNRCADISYAYDKLNRVYRDAPLDIQVNEYQRLVNEAITILEGVKNESELYKNTK